MTTVFRSNVRVVAVEVIIVIIRVLVTVFT
jgi:hypothetical protein